MCLFQPRRPTWFEDETVAKTAAEPMHGLRLIIKEDVLPLSDHPKFEALAEVAKRGLLAPETCFFSVQRLHGFRQVVQHVQLHVAK